MDLVWSTREPHRWSREDRERLARSAAWSRAVSIVWVGPDRSDCDSRIFTVDPLRPSTRRALFARRLS